MRLLDRLGFSNGIPLGPLASNDTAVGTYVDASKFSELMFVFTLGSTTVDMTAIKLQESDTTSGFSDITSAALTGATFSATSDGSIGIITLKDLSARKRYINAYCDPGAASTTMNGLFIGVLKTHGDTATERGVLEMAAV